MENINIHESAYNDDFLKDKLNDKAFIKVTHEDFTNKTMDKVMQEWVSNPINENKSKHSTHYWLILFTSISMAALIYLATDFRKLINMSDINWLKSFDSTYLAQINNLYNYILTSISNVTPLIFIILVAVVAIVIVDKVLKRFPKYSNVYIL